MTDKLKQIIKEELEKLPKENQEAINTLDWPTIAEEIGKKYLLDEEKINDLQVETLLVLVGITDPQFYPTNIENQVETTKSDAVAMAEEVTQKIFTPINDSLIEKIKQSDKVKNSKAEENLNFILAGGDYSAFLVEDKETEEEEPVVPVFSLKEENFKK